MKKLKYIFLLFISLTTVVSCEDTDYEFGDIVNPSNVEIMAEIIGQDMNDPDLMYGNGEGFVKFTATADDVISYVFDFGDGKSEVAPSGEFTHRYTDVGVNKFIATVRTIGTAGVSSTSSIEIEVYSSFTDPEAENLLSGELIGDSKTWYWAADQPLHIGLGPVTDDYGNGEFAYQAWWNSIQPWDEEKYCMYANEFVFTRTVDGITFEQTAGPAFVPGAYADAIGVEGDVCHDEAVAPGMFGLKQVSFSPSTSKAALEGTYNNEAYRGTTFEISDDGFMGWFVGSSTYDIIYVTENELMVRIIQDGDGFAWYQLFTSTKPVEGGSDFDELIWADEFDVNGAPSSTNWTYDLGAGGWGNNEVQTYTDNSENVIVEDGVLKIIAKSDGSGGYTSARLKSDGLFGFKYGRVDVRAKLPSAQGTWPAIWMLGDNFSTVGWPACGEIDIMEQTGQDKGTSLGTLHWLDSNTNTTASYGLTTAVTDASTEFHIYSLEWTEGSVKILLDDVMFFEMDNNADLPFDEDFHFLLNIAMGGTLGGTIDPAFTEDVMEIDYIRVYQ